MLKSRSIFPSSLGHFLSLIHRQLVALSRKEIKCSNPTGEPIKASAFRTVKGSGLKDLLLAIKARVRIGRYPSG